MTLNEMHERIRKYIEYLEIDCPCCDVFYNYEKNGPCKLCGREEWVFEDNKINLVDYLNSEYFDESVIAKLTIDCPDCKHFGGDDQFTCITCWQEGGGGKIYVLEYIKDNIPGLIKGELVE